jgi:hypothetical protein
VNPRIDWGQPPAGWGQPHFPGWAPLVDHGPRPLRAASSVARWWWPTLAVGSFLAVVAYIVGHDDPAPGLSHHGLLTVALAALMVVLLTLHRRYGWGSLARAVTEYTVVALLTTLLATASAGVDQQPADPTKPTKAGHAKVQPDAKPSAEAAAGDNRPAVLRAGAKVVRAVTGAARALAGVVRWLVNLWRQADRNTEPTNSQAMAASLPSPAPSALSTWRSP